MTAVKTPHQSVNNELRNPHQALPFDLDQAIETISHWLPTQGPIKDFIHHNTLHMVQHHPFHEGVAIAAKTLGARSYLPLADYQRYYREGRIDDSAIDWAIDHADCDSHDRNKLRASLFIEDHKSHYPPLSLANHGIRDLWLTRLEERGPSLRIAGTTYSSVALSDFMANLKASGRFKDVDLLDAKQDLSKSPRTITFEVSCRFEI